jgi:hypothetical protein
MHARALRATGAARARSGATAEAVMEEAMVMVSGVGEWIPRQAGRLSNRRSDMASYERP